MILEYVQDFEKVWQKGQHIAQKVQGGYITDKK